MAPTAAMLNSSVFPALSLGVYIHANTHYEAPTHTQPSLLGHKKSHNFTAFVKCL